MQIEPLSQPAPASPSSGKDEHPELKLICFIIAVMLIFSLSLNVFLFKNNRILEPQRNQQSEQVKRLQQTEAILNTLLQDVANFSIQHPEVKTILSKYGIHVQVAPGAK